MNTQPAAPTNTQAPAPPPYEEPGFPKPKLLAETLEQLEEKCGRFGKAACREVRWGAITVWLMKDHDDAVLSNPIPVVNCALSLIREHDRVRLGYPTWQGGPWPRTRLSRLSRGSQAVAKRVARETMTDWLRAGRPYLTTDKFKSTHQYVASCPAFKQEYPA